MWSMMMIKMMIWIIIVSICTICTIASMVKVFFNFCIQNPSHCHCEIKEHQEDFEHNHLWWEINLLKCMAERAFVSIFKIKLTLLMLDKLKTEFQNTKIDHIPLWLMSIIDSQWMNILSYSKSWIVAKETEIIK